MSAERIGRLHVLTDETVQNRFDHVELARLAARGGADVVQLREKRPRPLAALVTLACRVRDAIAPYGASLIVDDHVEVALRSNAAGVHLGRDDLPPREARRRLGPEALIGGTANGFDEALRVAREPVDYLGVGPVFGTRSKRDPAPPLGLAELERIADAVPRPIIAIGNITARQVADVLASGARGVAVLSSVVCAEDPARACAELRDALSAAAGSAR